MSKKYSFFFHFNKPETRARGHNVLTIHFKKTCIIVRHIKCLVPCSTKERKTQPLCVIAGKCTNVVLENDTATIL